ncbi:MAG TPA: DUF6531 domain-containing protein [Actinoplanes sp.]|nr:DUF6531 domain-containing protein [Actinoplanes sp.]
MPASAGGEIWAPDKRNLAGQGWTTHRAAAPAARPATLRAGAGVTALAGRILTLDGRPLAKVTVSIDTVRATTDDTGQFLLAGVGAGHRVLRVDGASASRPGRVFGLHDIGVDVLAGTTTALTYPIWLTRLDTAHTVRFPSPATKEVVIGTPAIPGLKVHLPAGAVVRDVNGKVVTELGITAIPVDRPPFPLPKSQVPAYFTVQPGSAYVFPTGARIDYPNFTHSRPGAVMDFWHYEPKDRGWFVYGHGTVTPDGRSVVPDRKTEVYQFTGAMLITPGVDAPPVQAPKPGGGAMDADPVDLGSGLLVDTQTDLAVDDVLPIGVTRTYQQSDVGRRTFGIGANFDYDLGLYSNNQWVDGIVVLPDGGQVHYHRISPGGTGGLDYVTAVFEADPTPTAFNKSILAWNGNGFDLRMRDGTTYVFGEESPLQAIRDKFGNTITITRAPIAPDPDGAPRNRGPITQVTSPNGRWISFTRDSANRVTAATDNAGHSVSYTYDSTGRLRTVTDANGGVTTYTYDSAGRLTTVKDARQTVYMTNTYDTNGRVRTQTTADGGVYTFDYTLGSGGQVAETRLTDPKGHVRRVVFNSAGFAVGDTAAYGTADAQVTTITRDSSTNLPTDVVDALGRRTTVAYDGNGNPTTITELAGTTRVRTTTTEYGGPFDQISKVTDPLQRATTFTYQNNALRTVTDPESRTTTFTVNSAGQATAVSDNAGKSATFTYAAGVPVTATDQIGRVSRQFTNAAGYVTAAFDAQGSADRSTYDAMGRPLTVTDPIGRLTTMEYDPNGNLAKVTDPRGGITTYTYDTSDRPTRQTDPLNRATSYTWDRNGNPDTVTSAQGRTTTFAYDNLDRKTSIRYGSDSSITYTYDAGNRVLSIADTTGGTTTFTPDDFDRTTRETGPRGRIDYTYDAGDRRTTMTVAGQPTVTYGYNRNDQLVSQTDGTRTAAIGYDTVGRRKTLALPGVTQTYGYDDAGQLTGITYTNGSATLGNLTYGYDPAGRPIHVGGSYARADIPAAYGPVSFDAANQLAGNTYDADGNLTGDGTTTYTWNARNELTRTVKPGLTVEYGYDGLGRRGSRTSNDATTGYLYDGLDPVQELAGSTPSANLLTGGLDETFTRTTSAGSKTLLRDGLGSTLGTADPSGTVTGEYSYQPFGTTTTTGDDGGNPYRFTGREDDGSGLYYYTTTATATTSRPPDVSSARTRSAWPAVAPTPTRTPATSRPRTPTRSA